MKSLFEEMGGTYHEEGDYFLPDLSLPETAPVGIWGQRRKHYLKTQRGPIYTALLLSGELNSHLSEIDIQAEGNIIKKGYNEEVDKLKVASTEGKNWLIDLETREKEETGIKNLKVSYNKVFGYYIEVTKSNLKFVPDRYIRKQTLTNGERYITEELKEIESTILGSQEKLIDLEYKLFLEIRDKISKEILRIQKTAEIVAQLDVLASFAQIAEDLNYVMPIVDNSGDIDIKEGRHPVIEKMISARKFCSK